MGVIQELYIKVFNICVQFAVFKNNNIQKEIEGIIPLIDSFSHNLLSGNTYGIRDEDYQLLCNLAIDILKDLSIGMENRDIVLLEDTLEYGLKDFLEIFMDDEELIELRKVSINE